jgi:DNA helicase-2/ATP-dependent DNA helicase PcrA
MRSAWGQPTYNPPSRFLAEIPESLMEWRRGAAVDAMPSSAPVVARLATASGPRQARSRPVVQLAAGDRVTHDAFGLGTVIQVDGQGDRAVAHIEFRDQGVKRLLLRYAPVEKL